MENFRERFGAPVSTELTEEEQDFLFVNSIPQMQMLRSIWTMLGELSGLGKEEGDSPSEEDCDEIQPVWESIHAALQPLTLQKQLLMLLCWVDMLYELLQEELVECRRVEKASENLTQEEVLERVKGRKKKSP